MRAVTDPIADIAAVFLLMVFVIVIFTMVGLYSFGQLITLETGEMQLNMTSGFIEPAEPGQCPNLAACFIQILDVGLRSGDIVGESFDDVTYEDGAGPWLLRVTYGLLFFLVIGVILFDIVTGIIIDKFSALREETAVREKYFLEVLRFSFRAPFPTHSLKPSMLVRAIADLNHF